MARSNTWSVIFVQPSLHLLAVPIITYTRTGLHPRAVLPWPLLLGHMYIRLRVNVHPPLQLLAMLATRTFMVLLAMSVAFADYQHAIT